MSMFVRLLPFALGGILGFLEAVYLYNPYHWFFLNDDRSAYLYAFVIYSLTFGVLITILNLVRKKEIVRTTIRGFLLFSLAIVFFHLGRNWFWKNEFLLLPAVVSAAVILIAGMLFLKLTSGVKNSEASPKVTFAVNLIAVLFLSFSILHERVPAYHFLRSPHGDSNLPNIVFISMDTTRADALHSYGYKRPTSPNIDAIAKSGALFRNAYTPATWTLPSHASLFTGQFPSSHGVSFQNFFLSPALRTLPEILQSHGYLTGGFIGGPFLSSNFKINQGFDYYDQKLDNHRKMRRFALVRLASSFINVWAPDGQRSAKQINLELKPFLDSVAGKQPFFLFVNYFDPHDPYDPLPASLKALGLEKRADGDLQQAYLIDRNNGIAKQKNGVPLSAEEFQALRDLYDAEVHTMDQSIGELYGWFRQKKLLSNTIFVLFADHGESIGEHQFLDHGHTLYQEQINIPLIISGRRIPPGLEVDDPVQIVDVMPTILEILRFQVPSKVQGRSFLPLLRGEDLPQRPVIGELDIDKRPNFLGFQRSLRMILEDDVKYIESSRNTRELYDLRQDPAELHNAIESKPETAEAQSQKMKDLFNLIAKFRFEGSGEMDEETLQRLRALGYVQ